MDKIMRTATLADLDAVAAVEAACFPEAEAATREELADRLTHYGDHFWLLFDGGTLIAFVDGMVTDRADLTDDLYADASLHADARAQGRRGLVLTCKDRLVHYYAKFGFVSEGVSESTHGGVVWYQMRLTF